MDLVARMPLGTPVEVLPGDGGETVAIVRCATPVAAVSMVGYTDRGGVRSLLLFDESSRTAARSPLGKGDPMEPLVEGVPYIHSIEDEVGCMATERLRQDARRHAGGEAGDGGFDQSLVPAAYRAVLDEAVGGIPDPVSDVWVLATYPGVEWETHVPRRHCSACVLEACGRIDRDEGRALRFRSLCLADREAAVRALLDEVGSQDGLADDLGAVAEEDRVWAATCEHVRSSMGGRIDAIVGLCGSLGSVGRTCRALFDNGVEARMVTGYLRDAALRSGPGPIDWSAAMLSGPEPESAGEELGASDAGLVRVTFHGKTVWEADGEPLR